MNKLFVPETTSIEKFKNMFLPAQKRAMFSYWLTTSIYQSIMIAIASLLLVSILGGTIYSFLYALLLGLVDYTFDSRIVENYRKKIIADMESAEPLVDAFDTNNGDRQNGTYIGKVSTMAGGLTFISHNPSSLDIEKKHGKLFDYYVYKNTEDIDEKDLRIFIALKPDIC